MGRPRLPATIAGFHRCKLCKEWKPLVDFYKESRRPDGHGYLCKPCNKIWKRQHWASYKVRLGETLRERERARYARDRDKRKRQSRESRERNGARWNAADRARHAANPVPNMLANAKTRARRKGIEFNLSAADITVPTVCPALGIPLVVTPGKTTANSPSLDRIDNAMGYVAGNVTVVSFKANTIKNSATVDELRRVANFYEAIG